jgi:hypothetical protein
MRQHTQKLNDNLQQPLKLKKILKSPIPKDSYGYDEISTKLLKIALHS